MSNHSAIFHSVRIAVVIAPDLYIPNHNTQLQYHNTISRRMTIRHSQLQYTRHNKNIPNPNGIFAIMTPFNTTWHGFISSGIISPSCYHDAVTNDVMQRPKCHHLQWCHSPTQFPVIQHHMCLEVPQFFRYSSLPF